jgi:hypothetical protein
MAKRLPRYGRVSNPPAFRLTERDKRIIEAVHAYDGLLSFSQIRRLFFNGKSQAELRLRFLYQHKFLNRLGKKERLRAPEMVYWLDQQGAGYVASLEGIPLSEFSWRKEPRWFQIEHDILVNDFRLDLEQACQSNQNVDLESWLPESEFWAYPDRIEYTHNNKTMKRYIRPDGYFMLATEKHLIRYLLEIDRSTEDNPRFFREKILPGLAYIKSQAYQERFGHRSGRWLVVTTGERRMKNMLRQAKKAEAKGVFYFTTFDQVNVETILFSPIWRREDRPEAVPLLFIDP